MADKKTKECVLAFVDAFYAGDVPRLESCCDEAFTSLTYAPVEIFPHLGFKQGKAWIAQAIRIQQERYSSRRYTLHSVVVEDAQAATLVQANLTKRSDQRIVQLTVGEFYTLRDGLIVEHRAFFDSFDLLQQVLGRDLTETFTASVRLAGQS
jgi:ketosteroid isomerase-like protein